MKLLKLTQLTRFFRAEYDHAQIYFIFIYYSFFVYV